MNRDNQLEEYLKGALAGKLIDNSDRSADCDGSASSQVDSKALQLDAPATLLIKDRQDLHVHVRNFTTRPARGLLLLKGDETVRGVSYEFDAPFELDEVEGHCCVTFAWRAPSYATRIKWSATVQFEGQMGFSLPECSAATIVRDPADPTCIS